MIRRLGCLLFGHDWWLCRSCWRCHRCEKWEDASVYDHSGPCVKCRVEDRRP